MGDKAQAPRALDVIADLNAQLAMMTESAQLAVSLSHRYRSDAARLMAAGAGLREVVMATRGLGAHGALREWDRAVQDARRPAIPDASEGTS